MKYLYSICLLLFILACSQTEETFSGFDVEYSLVGDSLRFSGIYNTMGIVNIVDSLVFLTDTPDNEYCIHIHRLTDLSHYKSFGRKGKGPKEIVSIGYSAFDKNQTFFWYRDLGRRLFWKYEIPEMLKVDNYEPVESLKMPDHKMFIHYFYKNESFYYVDLSKEYLISSFGEDGISNVSVKNKLVPRLQVNNVGIERKYGLYSIEKHPEKEEFIVCDQYCDLISVVNGDGDIIHQKYGPLRLKGEVDFEDVFAKRAYDFVRCTREYIYAAFYGKPLYIQGESHLERQLTREIFVFNWELKPIAKLKLDKSYFHFDVNEENEFLVIYSPDDCKMYKYELPEF